MTLRYPYLKTLFSMGLLSWILSACDLSSPKEQERFGYSLPIDSTTAIWTDYFTKRNWHNSITVDNLLFTPKDEHKNLTAFENQGIGVIDLNTNQVLWQTPFPVEKLVSRYNLNDTSYVTSSSIILKNNRLFCSYLHIIPPQVKGSNDADTKPKDFWEYVILDAQTGKLLKHERMPETRYLNEFIIINDDWFISNRKNNQFSHLDPASGQKYWSYPELLTVSTVTENAVSFYKKQHNDTWQVKVLDLNTGQLLFDYHFDHFLKHIIKGVLYRKGIVYVEMGAQYEMNLELGTKYRTYTVAFDAKSGKPLWRTPFFK
jgi:outer membrane protein assembly factor BamB